MNGRRPVRHNRKFLSQRNYKYNQISKEPPKKKQGIKLSLILGIIFIIVVGGVVSLFLFFSGEETEESPLSNTDPSIQPSIILCESWGCFIDASENCDLADYTIISTINLFGLDITTTTYYGISGKQGTNCIFKLRTEEQHVNYTDELIQQLLDGGVTQEEIDQQEQESNILSDSLEGREGVCEFIPSNLKSLLGNWEVGNFSSSDWELAESCEGEYFSSVL